MIQKEKEKETISMVCSNGQNLSDCIKSMNGKDETFYYHDSSLENGTGDNSYRYVIYYWLLYFICIIMKSLEKRWVGQVFIINIIESFSIWCKKNNGKNKYITQEFSNWSNSRLLR